MANYIDDAIDISGLENKTENDGTTAAGRISATEWNTLVTALETEQDNTQTLDGGLKNANDAIAQHSAALQGIENEIDGILDTDDEPTAGSDKLVKSGGVYGAIYGKYIHTDVTSSLTQIQNKVVNKSTGAMKNNASYDIFTYPLVDIKSINGSGAAYKGDVLCSFYSTDTITTEGWMSEYTIFQTATSYTRESFSLNVPTGARLIAVVVQHTAPSDALSLIVTSQAESTLVLRDEYEQFAEDMNAARSQVDELKDVNEDLLNITPANILYPNTDDFSIDGHYSEDDTSTKSEYGYRSTPLIQVAEGQIIKWHRWMHNSSGSTAIAINCYDNDGNPYKSSGLKSRVNWNGLTTIDYTNGEYTFVIPSNCSQIGLNYSTQYPPFSDGSIEVNEKIYSLTEIGNALVQNAMVGNEDTGDTTSKYYLKGNSNIVYSSSKKLGIIAAGQSNIDGRNSYSDLPSGFVNPNSKVQFCKNTNGTFSAFEITDGGANNDWSFDAIVYDTLTNPLYGNQSEIYVMKKSMGGTSIDIGGATDYHWTADYEYITPQSHSLLRTFESIIRAGIASQGSNFEIKAFLWHQGEGDSSISEAVALRYYDNLKNMLAYVRGIVGNPRLHIFSGTIASNDTYKDIVNEAINRVAQEDYYFHVVDMTNAALEDNWHFNYEWSIYFGQKVYDLMIDYGVISGTKINPIEPS